jgi:YidC/Oxa1 family membrane protein insertase
MKKQDYLIFFSLVALLFAWPSIYQKFFAPPPPPPGQVEEVPGETGSVGVDEAAEQVMVEDEVPSLTTTTPVVETATVPDDGAEATLLTLINSNLQLKVSTRGAAVLSAELRQYRENLPLDSPLVLLDFEDRPALVYSGLPGFSGANNFTVELDESPERVVLTRDTPEGLVLRREIALGSNYLVTVRDTFVNNGETSVDLGRHTIQTGPIAQEAAHSDMVGVIDLGVDALPPAGGVQNWGKVIAKQFRTIRDERELPVLPEEITFRPGANPADWASAKNKYFVQILMPDGTGADWIEVFARRVISPAELAGARVRDAEVEAVAAILGFDSQTLGAGDSYTRTFEYYVGPKNYNILASLSHGRDGAMGFEENAYMDFLVVPSAKILLNLLNFLHDNVAANYGVAIILLTLIVRILFWPITHKGTESMRRMASVQPQMAEVREKYKDNPQKMQQAMMALYKEHKINPLGGCLPMLVQIPVFFALFVVLRIAIELRFAEFLWISDLSAPERLIEFGFTIPLLGWDALNILPLLMTATMVIQQKLTPTAGDPAQQKIMLIMMPAMMLFFLYNFASGLALYWTTQNVLMIVQQLIYLQRKKRQEET